MLAPYLPSVKTDAVAIEDETASEQERCRRMTDEADFKAADSSSPVRLPQHA
jgi:hypothetical protein